MSRRARIALLGGVALIVAAGATLAAVTPDALRAVEGESTVELTTTGRKSGQARTVTIWFVRDGDHLYVQSGQEGKTDWYRNVLGNPVVTLRIGALRMKGRARPVEDTQESDRVHALFEQKYVSARVMGWFGGGFGHGKVVRIDSLE